MQTQKVGKYKSLMRSARYKARNQAIRPTRVARSRKRKLKNAERCSGKAFADKLRLYYAKNTPASKKAGKYKQINTLFSEL